MTLLGVWVPLFTYVGLTGDGVLVDEDLRISDSKD